MIEAKSIIKSYDLSRDNNIVLNCLNFTINKGEVVSIIGPSGCGKSTLLRLLGKREKVTGGSLKITLDESLIFYSPQSPVLLPWLTIKQNLILPYRLNNSYNINKTLIENSITKITETVSLKEALDYYPKELSGGMKERAVFAQMLSCEYKLLLMDEPLSSVDEFNRYNLLDLARSLWNKKEQTIIWVTHNIEEAIYISDRIILLSNIPTKIIAEYKIENPRPSLKNFFENEEYQITKTWIFDKYKSTKTQQYV